jgi:hypothetical protein
MSKPIAPMTHRRRSARSKARRYINRQIADPLDFDDNIALARLDDKIEDLQEQRRRYDGL